MMNKIVRSLAIAVDSLEPTTVAEAVSDAEKDNLLTPILIAVAALVAVALVIIVIKSHPIEKIRAKSLKKKKDKEEKARNQELERLHEIKRKNKRK